MCFWNPSCLDTTGHFIGTWCFCRRVITSVPDAEEHSFPLFSRLLSPRKVVCPLKDEEWDALNIESNPELWSVVSVVRLPPVGRNTEEHTILLSQRSTGVISRWTGRRFYPTRTPDITFYDVKNSIGSRKTGQLVELLPTFRVCTGASCCIEYPMWRSSVRAAPSRANFTLYGERTHDLASGKLLSRPATGAGLLTEVQEVACLGVYRTQRWRHLWALMRVMYVPTHVCLWITLTWGFPFCLIFFRWVALFEASVVFLPSLAKDVPHLVSWNNGGLLTKKVSKIDAAEFGAHWPYNPSSNWTGFFDERAERFNLIGPAGQ